MLENVILLQGKTDYFDDKVDEANKRVVDNVAVMLGLHIKKPSLVINDAASTIEKDSLEK